MSFFSFCAFSFASSKARRILDGLGACSVGTDHQVDTYFRTLNGRFKLRESSMSGAQLIPYVRPDLAGPKRSDYILTPIEDVSTCKRLFTSLLGIEAVVHKVREVARLGNIRVHLDSVQSLGNFIEFEAVFEAAEEEQGECQKVEALMQLPSQDTLP
jgi:adenylate cyclase class IV